jgi:tetratricopeptide (TPR) repeat protein
MKHIILFLSLILCFGQTVSSQMNAVKQANYLYAKGDYSNAAKIYEKILAKDGIAPEIYFNLGNAYYKSNEIGRSILNYERALRLSPSFDDARFNLELAQLKVVDNIVPSPTFFIGRWIQNLIKLLTSDQWLFISVGVFIFCFISIFLFIFSSVRLLRKMSFYFAICLFGISFFTLIFAGIRKGQLINHSEAIVMTGVISVKSSPDKSGTDLFQLHEGAKVYVKSTLGSWLEIKLANGGIGWVEQVNVEKI